jgi:hypothetical protein
MSQLAGSQVIHIRVLSETDPSLIHERATKRVFEWAGGMASSSRGLWHSVAEDAHDT